MQILSVTLKNFKSHSDRQFYFQPGTNAICGENGAGKTSILEAIAWALFNHRGAYKLEDLVRNGSSSAQVTVQFVSNRDGRTYNVQRCTTKGYTLFDPQVNERLEFKHIESEVLPWLRQHLGVAPGTDLARLFANTIGVPQGTFTADFLKTAEERKRVFDAILKVEEYKQANQEMLSLEKYAKAQEETLQRAIAQYDETLLERESLQQRQQKIQQEIEHTEHELKQLEIELATLQIEKDRLAAQAKQVQNLEIQLKTLNSQLEAKQQTQGLLEAAVQRATAAVRCCEDNRPGYATYLQAETILKELDRQQKQRQKLAQQRQGLQKIWNERQTDLTRLTVQLENLLKAAAEIERLAPLVLQQQDWQSQQQAIAAQLQSLQALRVEQQATQRQIAQLQTEQHRLGQEIEQLKALAPVVEQIPELEHRRDRLQSQLSRIDAAQQFEQDLRQLVKRGEAGRDRHQLQASEALRLIEDMQQTVSLFATASLQSALTAIQSGVELNSDLLQALREILTDLAEQTSAPKLKQQLQSFKKQLDLAYQQRAEFLTLETQMDRRSQLHSQLQQLQQQSVEFHQQLIVEAELQEQMRSLATQVLELGNPLGKSQLLQRDLQQREKLQTHYDQARQSLVTIEDQMTTLDEQLVAFAELEAQMDAQKQLKQQHQPAYLLVLQNQKEAEQLPQLTDDLQTAIALLHRLSQQQQQLQDEYARSLQNYDPQQWHQVEATYADRRSQADRLAGGLPQQRKLLEELDHRLQQLQEVASRRDRTQAELKQHEKTRRFIAFARKAYKEAGPRITERYVLSISREADRLFRELMNRPNLALEWTRDYEILVQEGAHTRRLINLSGGEQMCAALAVRLALLRVLADIDIAFFDEPTTNMDRSRRESLAEAIANIKSFRQLFVISHDDTFEKITENVIVVEREAS